MSSLSSTENLITILASQSPSRSALLKQCGIKHKQVSPLVIEAPFKEGSASDFAIELAFQKASSLVSDFPSAFIIGADQILLQNGKVFSKPQNKQEAITQLQALQGREHTLYSGLTCFYRGKYYRDSIISIMNMRELTDEEIYGYIEKEDSTIACGSYLYESLGLTLFSKIETTDPSAILGLPCTTLIAILNKLGFSPLV